MALENVDESEIVVKLNLIILLAAKKVAIGNYLMYTFSAGMSL